MQAKLIPAPGKVVLDPITKQPLKAEGENRELNSYWIRRRNDGDVSEAPMDAPPAASAAAPAKPKKGTSEG